MNRPTAGKNRSAGSNARVVCSTLPRAMPIRQGFPPCQSAPGAFSSVSAQTSYTPATPFMRKEFKRGIPSSFCPFRTFRTGEKYLMFHVLLHDQKYQKSSKTFPLRNLPVISHLLKRAQRLGCFSAQTSCTPATPFICGRGTSAYANLLDSFV